ncbi:MAG: methionyl-tRNA formyltransferase [Candidatus Aminicenantales bacterium]
MRVVFFGSPEAALPSFARLLKAGYEVDLVVTQPDRPAGRGKKVTAGPIKKFALERGIAISQPERIRTEAAAFAAIRDVQADVHVVVAYGQIIPTSIIDLPRHKSLNVHFSLLPKYRGASPVSWAILNGETKTGVTIIRLNAKMDEGDILSATETDIFAGENAGELESRLAEIGAGLLLDTLSHLESITPLPQDHSLACLAPKIKKEDGKIVWSMDAGLIDRKVRAFSPRPSAFTFLRGQRLIILKGRALAGPAAADEPGKVLSVSKEGLDVCCKNKTIYRILRLQPESKGAMEAHAYTLSGKIGLSDILG